MSEPFLAEIRIVGFNFAPRGWAFCDGQILPINQNQSLYSLLGTTYGGDGRTSFALPDIRGRSPIHKSDSKKLGGKGGQENVALSSAQTPSHTHTPLRATNASASVASPGPTTVPCDPGETAYLATTDARTLVNMATTAITNAGGGQAHTNMQPFLTLAYIIALRGLFPSRN